MGISLLLVLLWNVRGFTERWPEIDGRKSERVSIGLLRNQECVNGSAACSYKLLSIPLSQRYGLPLVTSYTKSGSENPWGTNVLLLTESLSRSSTRLTVTDGNRSMKLSELLLNVCIYPKRWLAYPPPIRLNLLLYKQTPRSLWSYCNVMLRPLIPLALDVDVILTWSRAQAEKTCSTRLLLLITTLLDVCYYARSFCFLLYFLSRVKLTKQTKINKKTWLPPGDQSWSYPVAVGYRLSTCSGDPMASDTWESGVLQWLIRAQLAGPNPFRLEGRRQTLGSQNPTSQFWLVFWVAPLNVF
jgi:hypothetical protein